MIHTPPGSWPTPGPEYLAPTRLLDCDHPEVRRFAEETAGSERTDVAKAIALFYRVRDGWRYDPYSIRLTAELHTASRVLHAHAAYCIPKAILFAAAARAVGLQSALGFSDVENHLCTARLRQRMGGTSLFIDHGYALVLLDGRWIRAAPAFDRELCRRFEVRPTEFDGRHDAILQEFDARDRRHIVYVRHHGYWSDFPLERVFSELRAAYPNELFEGRDPPERFEDGERVR